MVPGRKWCSSVRTFRRAPFKLTFKEIVTIDLLTVKSVATNFRETGQASQGFVIVVYKAQNSWGVTWHLNHIYFWLFIEMMLKNHLRFPRMHYFSLPESFITSAAHGVEDFSVLPSSVLENYFVVVLWFPSKVKHSLSSPTTKSKSNRITADKIIEAVLQDS